MRHRGTKSLHTKRLILRMFTVKDLEELVNGSLSEEEIRQNLRWCNCQTVEELENRLTNWVLSYEKLDFYQWAVVEEESQKIIGTIGVVGQCGTENILAIGYFFHANYWNKGFATEAFTSLLPFFFDEVKVEQIFAYHEVDNPASGRVMEKCGLNFIGFLTENKVAVYRITVGNYQKLSKLI